MMRLALVGLAACSSSSAKPCADGSVCDGACPAVLTGNFAESSVLAANCATLQPGTGSASSDELLGFVVASKTIDNPITISIDLGASPQPGMSSSETIDNWSVLAATAMGDGGCVYSAGDQAVPTGSFTLTITAITDATAHGQLEVLEYVHALADTNCGAGNNETIDVTF